MFFKGFWGPTQDVGVSAKGWPDHPNGPCVCSGLEALTIQDFGRCKRTNIGFQKAKVAGVEECIICTSRQNPNPTPFDWAAVKELNLTY